MRIIYNNIGELISDYQKKGFIQRKANIKIYKRNNYLQVELLISSKLDCNNFSDTIEKTHLPYEYDMQAFNSTLLITIYGSEKSLPIILNNLETTLKSKHIKYSVNN